MKCVLYLRVSKSDETQDPTNQRGPLKKLADSLGLTITKEYVDYASGGNSNRPQFQQMLADAKMRKFDLILVWSLDRFSREGISNTLGYLEALKRSGIALRSLQESWLDTSDTGVGELLISIMAWVAKQERTRISERTKAGLKTAKANGKLLGRRNGSKDIRKRSNQGYILRWTRERNNKVKA